jgi:hypothetical protein
MVAPSAPQAIEVTMKMNTMAMILCTIIDTP